MGTQLLQHDLTCAVQARRCVGDDLRRYHVSPECVDDVLLVISELVTNAVLHTGTDLLPADQHPGPRVDGTGNRQVRNAGDSDRLELGWQLDGDQVTVCVDDGDPTPPVPREAADADLNGRGLAIVAAIATEWGVSAHTPGKRVWARISVRRG